MHDDSDFHALGRRELFFTAFGLRGYFAIAAIAEAMYRLGFEGVCRVVYGLLESLFVVCVLLSLRLYGIPVLLDLRERRAELTWDSH